MKRTVLVLVVMVAAGRLTAQMVAGAVVNEGSAFPVVADLNHDGLDDLIQGHTVLFNNGGSFSAPVALGLEGADRVIEVLDANGDGRPDLLTQDTSVFGAAHYRLYLNTGDGGFTAAPGNYLPTPTAPYVADFDGDGVDDLILTTDVFKGMLRVATDITLLRSNANGYFERLNTYRIPPQAQILPGYRVLAGDLNHDGIPDLVIRCLDDLVVMRGTGGGAFEVETRYLPVPFGFTAKTLADIDGDGNLDFVLAEGREVLAFLGDGRGNFPRFASGAIEKKHDMAVPNTIRENAQQPRDIAIGNFTAAHPQIAVGTLEGDVVILEYRDGMLAEAARNLTESLLVSVKAGSFVSAGHSDIEASGTGIIVAPPRLLIGREKVLPASVPRANPRMRSMRDTSAAPVRFNVVTRGGCASNETVWTLRRDGAFNLGSSTDGGKVEIFIKGDWAWYRLNAPYSSDPVAGILVRRGDTYSGEVAVKTAACDWQIVDISATLAH
jgi:hypothetical protein